ncbi:MAG: family 10 glycosylhydrolase [Patescibacteria group bacterium]
MKKSKAFSTLALAGLLGMSLTACFGEPQQSEKIQPQAPSNVIELPTEIDDKAVQESKAENPNCKKAKKVGLYMTPHGKSYEQKRFQTFINKATSLGVDTFAVSYMYRGLTTVPDPSGIYKTAPDVLTKIGVARNLALEAKNVNPNLCFVAFMELGLLMPAKSVAVKTNPGYFLTRYDGKKEVVDGVEIVYVNIWNKVVRLKYLEYIKSVASKPGIDIVQFDDHFGISNYHGYSPESIQGFKQFLKANPATAKQFKGKADKPDPKDPIWIAYRTQSLTSFFGEVVKAAKSVNPNVKVNIVTGELEIMAGKYNQNANSFHQFGSNVGIQLYGSKETGGRDVTHKLARLSPNYEVALLLGMAKDPVPEKILIKNLQGSRQFKTVWFFGHLLLLNDSPESLKTQSALKKEILIFKQTKSKPNPKISPLPERKG